MPTPINRPELDVCIEAASHITASAIESGKLSADIDTVKNYFSDIYRCIIQARSGK